MSWKTIDSIPRDGTRILVVMLNQNGAKRNAVCCWDEDKWKVGTTSENHLIVLDEKRITHWQLLPELPE